jgi:hypothetical protein
LVNDCGKRLYNEELYNVYTSPNIIRLIKSRGMRWAEHVAPMEEMRNACNILVGKLKGMRPLRRPRCRWEANTGMDFKEIRWEGVDWLHLAQIGTSGGFL